MQWGAQPQRGFSVCRDRVQGEIDTRDIVRGTFVRTRSRRGRATVRFSAKACQWYVDESGARRERGADDTMTTQVRAVRYSGARLGLDATVEFSKPVQRGGRWQAICTERMARSNRRDETRTTAAEVIALDCEMRQGQGNFAGNKRDESTGPVAHQLSTARRLVLATASRWSGEQTTGSSSSYSRWLRL